MSKINGIYAASMSIIKKNLTLDVAKTIQHAEMIIALNAIAKTKAMMVKAISSGRHGCKSTGINPVKRPIAHVKQSSHFNATPVWPI